MRGEPEVLNIGILSAWALGATVALDVGDRVQIGVLTNIQHTNNQGLTRAQTFLSIEGHDSRWSGHLPSRDTEITLLMDAMDDRIGAFDPAPFKTTSRR